MANDKTNEREYTGPVLNGFLMLAAVLLIIPALTVLSALSGMPEGLKWAIVTLLIIIDIFLLGGFFVQQPNQARVFIFFGRYVGTSRATGFFWVNPLLTERKVSLRIRNMDIEPIKVNDKVGNPVMIGMVLVWKVCDTYRAIFDVDAPTAPVGTGGNTGKALENFVSIQSDAALREVTGRYAYDDETSHTDEITLRGGGEEVNDQLEHKLNERLAMAGIEVVEARINYLAYAPEIAAVMLRRQQASAIIAAREKIVEGAVSMVKMALNELSEQGVVELDQERKASMVSNLLVVLCADEPATPVVNTGSLYN